MNSKKIKGQGAFEYLLLIGGAILFVILAIAYISNTINKSSSQSSISASQTAEFDQIRIDCNGYGNVYNLGNKLYLNFKTINDPLPAHGVTNNGAALNATGVNALVNSYNQTFGGAMGVSGGAASEWINATLATVAPVTTGDFAISGWFNPQGGTHVWINITNSTASARPVMNITFNASGIYGILGGAEAGTTLFITINPFLGWNHVMFKRIGTNFSAWINGTYNASATTSFNFGSLDAIVASPLAAAGGYAGGIDELKFYLGTVSDAASKYEFRCIRPTDQ